MMSPDSRKKLDRLYGTVSPDQFFTGDRTMAPFPPAGRNKQGLPYDPKVVDQALNQETPQLVDVDPRTLHATQSHVTRPGVDYYMSGEYDRTGDTYADQHSPANRYPIVYTRDNGNGETSNIILTGHHRATAALLKGRPLRAINPQGGYGT
jgi:hypothetical protein